MFNISRQPHRAALLIHNYKNLRSFSSSPINFSKVSQIFNKIPIFNVERLKLRASGYFLYETVADQVPYDKFIQKYNLRDTFYTWFLISELHVWMLSVRAMENEKNGKFVRNCIIEALWKDTEARIKKLGVSSVKDHMEGFSQQFNAALFRYDEGLQSSDATLAGALWYRIFEENCDDLAKLETLVEYVRKQVHNLDNLDADSFFYKRRIKWDVAS